jgi:hypothetical protein
MTRSCMYSVLEKQIVRRTNRLTRVRRLIELFLNKKAPALLRLWGVPFVPGECREQPLIHRTVRIGQEAPCEGSRVLV